MSDNIRSVVKFLEVMMTFDYMRKIRVFRDAE